MKKLAAVAVMILLASACGRKEPASPLDVMPEGGLLMMAFSDPAAVVTAIDDYIEGGMPIAGPDLLENLILNEFECESFDSLTARLGIDVHGTIVFYAAGMNPQTIGAAVQVPDPDLFWENTTEWGAEWTDADPVGDAVVKSLSLEEMTVQVATYRGLALIAGSRTEISAMIDRIEGNAPRSQITLEPAQMWMKLDVSMFGPMVSSQLAMYRPQIMGEIQADMGGTPMEEMAAGIIGVYFDIIDLFLRETGVVEYTVTFGPENVDAVSTITFVPGSSLAAACVPIEAEDYLSMLPAGGMMTVRLSLPEEMTVPMMTALLDAMGMQYDPAMIELSAGLSRNTAFTMFDDLPMHFVAVYGMPDGAGMEQVRQWIDMSLDMAMSVFAGTPGFTVTEPMMVNVDGIDYLTYSTVVDPGAFAPEGAEGMPVMPAMDFTVWLAQGDGVLLLEMAPQPILLPSIIAGIQGETAGSSEYIAGAGIDKEMVYVMDFGAYMRTVMSWMGEMPVDLSGLTEPAWIYSTVDLRDGALVSSCSFSGIELTRFIGTFAASAGGMNID